tara:strand:- start:212 stop:1132 length:921 start_codon:yes stop_codon:yes gene_type:complete
MNFKQYIESTAERCFISIAHNISGRYTKKLYTLRESDIPTDDPKEVLRNAATATHVRLYDITKKVYTDIAICDIHSVGVDFAEDPEGNKFVTDARVEQYTEYMNHCACCLEEEEGCCEITDKFDDLYWSSNPDIFKILSIFKHEIADHDLFDDDISNDKMEKCRGHWMNLVRKYRTLAFEELDDLEKESDNPDDLADIDSIKQMFRDIPQDTDLTEYKTVQDLIDFWPPLLLPVPEEIAVRHFDEDNMKGADVSEERALKDLEVLLDAASDVEELQDLYNIIKDIETVPETSKTMLSDRITEITNS